MHLYPSFKEAHTFLKIKDKTTEYVSGDPIKGISSLRMIYNTKSLNVVHPNNEIVYFVGKGKQQTSGYPILNQNALDQLPFFQSKLIGNAFPLLYKDHNKNVELLGHYTVIDVKKTQTASGFTYFKVVLLKQY